VNPLRWRKMTWVLNAWNVIFLIWIVAGSISGAHQARKDCSHPFPLTRQECLDASHAGTGIGVAFIILLWFLGFIVLALVWIMTRRRGRICPHCGEDVKKGRTTCNKCGYDFTTGTKPNLPVASQGEVGLPVLQEHPIPKAPQTTPPESRPGAVVADRPAAAVTRMEEAEAAFKLGDVRKALTPLWDELDDASRRGDTEQLEAIQTLAHKMQQASSAEYMKRAAASLVRASEAAAANIQARPHEAAEIQPNTEIAAGSIQTGSTPAAIAVTEERLFCEQCGQRLGSTARFCRACGHPVPEPHI
jgi:hypothetical protein